MNLLEVVNEALAFSGDTPLTNLDNNLGRFAVRAVKTASYTFINQVRPREVVTSTQFNVVNTTFDFVVPDFLIPDNAAQLISFYYFPTNSTNIIYELRSIPLEKLSRVVGVHVEGKSGFLSYQLSRPTTVHLKYVEMPDFASLTASSTFPLPDIYIGTIAMLAGAILSQTQSDDSAQSSRLQRAAESALIEARQRYGIRQPTQWRNVLA